MSSQSAEHGEIPFSALCYLSRGATAPSAGSWRAKCKRSLLTELFARRYDIVVAPEEAPMTNK